MLAWRSQAVLSFGPSAPIQPPTPTHGAELVHPSFSWSTWWSQAVLSLGPSAPLHPPTARACGFLIFMVDVVVARGVVPRTFRFASSPHAWRRGAPRLRPRVARVLWTTLLATRHISAPADSCRAVLNIHIQSGPSTDISYFPSPCTALVCPIHLSSGMGLSTIVHFRTISYRRDALFQIAHTHPKDKHLITNVLQNSNV